MRIELAGWKSAGLRCPDVKIDLKDGDGRVAKVSLLQMPNGTGKTTTLKLLNAVLSGSATTWKPEQVRELKRPDQDVERGVFQAQLLIDGRPISIEMTLNFVTGQATYTTTNPGSGGIVQRWHVPPTVTRFLTPQFLSLFIFDGEFADKLLNFNLGEADKAVDALCELYLLDHVESFAKADWEERAKAAAGKSSQSLAKFKETRTQLLHRQDNLKKLRAQAVEQSYVLDNEIIDLQKRIDERINNVETTRNRYENAMLEHTTARAAVGSSAGELMNAMRLPHALHPKLATQLSDLRDNLDRLKLPENTSAQFFEELVQEAECICGREMDEAAAHEIGCRAKRYLDSDDAGVINALKRDIESFAKTTEADSGYARVSRVNSELATAVRRERSAEGDVRALKQQLIDDGDDLLASWETKLSECKTELVKRRAAIKQVDDPGDADEPNDQVRSLSLIEKRVEEINRKIAEVSQTVSLKKQTDLIEGLLKESAKRARARIKADLVTVCNERLSIILANDPLKISKIDQSVRLVGQEGASVGQSLSVGYTFLMSVLRRGNNDFPLIVDSPANPIDHGVRRRIGKLIPELCSQFIGFTINTERAGFVDALAAEVQDVKFLTLFRKTNGSRHLMANLPAGKFSESTNGVLIDDREYFYQFDLTDQEQGVAI